MFEQQCVYVLGIVRLAVGLLSGFLPDEEATIDDDPVQEAPSDDDVEVLGILYIDWPTFQHASNRKFLVLFASFHNPLVMLLVFFGVNTL